MIRRPKLSQKDAFALFSLSLLLKEGNVIDEEVRSKLTGADSGMAERFASLSVDELRSLKAAIATAAEERSLVGPMRAGELLSYLDGAVKRATALNG